MKIYGCWNEGQTDGYDVAPEIVSYQHCLIGCARSQSSTQYTAENKYVCSEPYPY